MLKYFSNENPTSWQKDDKKYSTVETSSDKQNYCSIIVGSKYRIVLFFESYKNFLTPRIW